MKKVSEMLTPRQYAEKHEVAYTTVMNWLQRGMIAEAVKHSTPTGHYWEIPENAPTPKLQPGRPPKADQAGGPDGKVSVKASKKGGKR